MKIHLDEKLARELGEFYCAVNARSEFKAGYRDRYDPPSEALGEDVEYFHPIITYDDRMRYIAENIVMSTQVSIPSSICNVVISHFYGARGVHQVLTGEDDPKKALIDFERLDQDERYLATMRENARRAKVAGKPIWGTTELHTSIQNEGNRYVKERYGEEAASPFAVAEWIGSWLKDGTVARMMAVENFEELYNVFRSKHGIGSYYAYHGAASTSNSPWIDAYQDYPFCDPGPGAMETAKALFPNITKRDFPLDERVKWVRQHQHEIMQTPEIHPDRWNIVVSGSLIYPEEQKELTVYGAEVLMCQFSVYCRLKNNPKLISKRKVARLDDCVSLESFFE